MLIAKEPSKLEQFCLNNTTLTYTLESQYIIDAFEHFEVFGNCYCKFEKSGIFSPSIDINPKEQNVIFVHKNPFLDHLFTSEFDPYKLQTILNETDGLKRLENDIALQHSLDDLENNDDIF